MTITNLKGIARTLLVPLACRALESPRPDAILHDRRGGRRSMMLGQPFVHARAEAGNGHGPGVGTDINCRMGDILGGSGWQGICEETSIFHGTTRAILLKREV